VQTKEKYGTGKQSNRRESWTKEIVGENKMGKEGGGGRKVRGKKNTEPCMPICTVRRGKDGDDEKEKRGQLSTTEGSATIGGRHARKIAPVKRT